MPAGWIDSSALLSAEVILNETYRNCLSRRRKHLSSLMYCGSVIALIASLSIVVYGSTECVWATGKVICHKNQTLVLGTDVELFDMDGPSKIVHKRVTRLGDDYIDQYLRNANTIYIRVHHYCNSPKGEFLKVLPTFRVFVPQTYDHHIRFPIELD
uniref:Uncharacterized protein n=1 Tax=Parascaris equorum TaxID=6256 RepID=A0A914RJA3_PAREQ